MDPDSTVPLNFQYSFSNIQCGVLEGLLTGPLVDSYNLCSCLEHKLSDLLDNMPLTTWAGMYFWHAGALLCLSTGNVEPESALSWSLHWLQRSRDLNCLDFNIWNYMKHLVYECNMDIREAFIHHIVDAVIFISAQETLHCIIHWVVEWEKICIETEEMHPEHLLNKWKSKVCKIVHNH